MKDKLISTWEMIWLIISIITTTCCIFIEVHSPSLAADFPIIISILTGLATGFIATIVVLYVDRRHKKRLAHQFYSEISGAYERLDMGDNYASEADLKNIRKENVGLSISLTYDSGHTFLIKANYWKSKKALAQGIIEFNPKYRTTAYGNYRYIQGEGLIGHLGTFHIERDSLKNELIIFSEHLFPRKAQLRAEENKGWEIWKKV